VAGDPAKDGGSPNEAEPGPGAGDIEFVPELPAPLIAGVEDEFKCRSTSRYGESEFGDDPVCDTVDGSPNGIESNMSIEPLSGAEFGSDLK
jgi:hypothetical protein